MKLTCQHCGSVTDDSEFGDFMAAFEQVFEAPMPKINWTCKECEVKHAYQAKQNSCFSERHR